MLAAIQEPEGSTVAKAMANWRSTSALHAMNALADSPVSKAIRALRNSPVLTAMQTIQDSPAIKAMSALQDSPALAVMRTFQASLAIKAMSTLQDSPGWAAIRTFQDSPVIKAISALHDSPTLMALSAFEEPAGATGASGMQRHMDEVLQWASIAGTLVENDLFRTIATADTKRLEALFRQAEDRLSRIQDVTDTATRRDTSTKRDEAEIGEELRLALLDGPPSKPLSASALLYLGRFIMCLWIVCQAIAQWPDFHAGACDLQARMLTLETRRDIRRFTKGLFCEIPRETLRRMRYVDRAGVPLYVRPAVRTQIVASLPKGAVLIVLDDSDRNWLYVQFSEDDVETEGWVSRKFARRFVQ